MSNAQYHSPIDATETWQPPLARRTAGMRPLAAILVLLRAWRQRQRLRHELSLMSARDFGDLAVPPGLVAEETRRWPWQPPSRQWGAIAARGPGGKDKAL